MVDRPDERGWTSGSGGIPGGVRPAGTGEDPPDRRRAAASGAARHDASGYAPGSRIPPGAGGGPSHDAWTPGEWVDRDPAFEDGTPGAWRAAPPERRYSLAGWWPRAAAAVIDGVLIGILALVLLVPLGAGLAGVDSDAGILTWIAAAFVTLVVFAVVSLLYAPLMLWKTDGKTVGRMVVGIRVVRATGEPMTLGVAVVREVVLKWLVFGAASSATGGIATLVDYGWPLWDEEHRALHDFPVNTRTVRD